VKLSDGDFFNWKHNAEFAYCSGVYDRHRQSSDLPYRRRSFS